MATAPSSFPTSPSVFFPTYHQPSPAPPPTHPASGLSPAPPYGHHTFPSTAAYPPTASGFSTAPIYPSPSAFSYAATYPYPHPTSAYNPAYGFSSYPSTAPYHHPFHSNFPSPIPSQIDPNQPPPAPPPNQGDPCQAIRFPYSHGHAPPPESTAPPTPAPPTTQADFLSVAKPAMTPQLLDSILTSPATSVTSAPATIPSAEKQAHAEAAISKNMPSVLRHMNRRLDEHQSQLRRSLASLQSELSKLVDMASSLNNSMAKAHSLVSLSASSTITTRTPSVGLAPSQGSTTLAASAHAMFSATSSMTATRATPMSVTKVPAAPAYVAPQALGEMPKQYDFQNLNRQSLFLADGTERSYFTLPADYPLEQPSPLLSPSAGEIVGGMAPQSVAAQAEGLAPVLCSTNSSAGSESLLVHDVQPPMSVKDVSNVSNEMQVYDVCAEDATVHCSCLNPTVDISAPDNEQAVVCGDKASDNGKAQQVNNQQLNRLLPQAVRKEWDPGTLKIIMDVAAVVKWFSLEGLTSPYTLLFMIVYAATSIPNILVSLSLYMLWDLGDIVGVLHTSILTEKTSHHLTECNSLKYLLQSAEIRYPRILSYFFILRYCSVKCNSWLKTVLQSMCDQVEGMNHLSLTTPWDPGVLVIHSGITCNSRRTTRDVEWLKMSISTSELPQSVSVKCSPFHMMSTSLNAIFSVQMMQYAIQSLMANISCKVAALTWHSSITVGSTASYIWDPGTMLVWYKSIWWLRVTEEKVMVGLISEQWSSWFNAVNYCQIFQNCHAMSSQLYWSQDIKLTGIDLWMIHFLPP